MITNQNVIWEQRKDLHVPVPSCKHKPVKLKLKVMYSVTIAKFETNKNTWKTPPFEWLELEYISQSYTVDAILDHITYCHYITKSNSASVFGNTFITLHDLKTMLNK